MITLVDSFIDTAGTAITAHTGDVQAVWTAQTYNAGTAVITAGNRVRPNTANAGTLYQSAVSPATADYDVSADVYIASAASGSAAGPAGRMISTGFYLARLNQTTGNLELYLNNAGGFTLLASVAQTQTVGNTYRLKLQMRGTTIAALCSSDGGQTYPVMCSAIDSTLTAAGVAGLQLFCTPLATDSTGYHLTNIFAVEFYAAPILSATADDVNLRYSGTWAQTGSGIAARAKTINTGNVIEGWIGGTQTLHLQFDTSGCASLSAPKVWVEVDEIGAYYTVPSSGNLTIAMPTENSLSVASSVSQTHKVRLVTEGIYEGSFASLPQGKIDQWTKQYGALSFQGLILDGGGATVASQDARPFIRFHGDSLTASVHTLSGGATDGQGAMAAHLYWPNVAAKNLGLRPCVVGFGSQGLFQNNNQLQWNGNASGNVPLIGSAFGYSFAGSPYSLPTIPLVEVLALGTNDAIWLANNPGSMTGPQFEQALLALLLRVRGSNPSGVIFYVAFKAVAVYSGSIDLRPYIQAAITAFGDPKVIFLDYSAVYSTSDTEEGIHPSVGGSEKIAAQLSIDVAATLGSFGIRWQNPAAASVGSPTTANLTLSQHIGYSAAAGNPIVFSAGTWPNIPAGTPVQLVDSLNSLVIAVGTMYSVSGLPAVSFDIPQSVTRLLALGSRSFQVRTGAASPIALVNGTLTVVW